MPRAEILWVDCATSISAKNSSSTANERALDVPEKVSFVGCRSNLLDSGEQSYACMDR